MNWFKRWIDRRLDELADKVADRIESRKPTKKEPTKIDLQMYENYQMDDTFTIGEIYYHKMKNPKKIPKKQWKGAYHGTAYTSSRNRHR